MRFGKRFSLKNMFTRIAPVAILLSFIITIMPLSPRASVAAAAGQALITDYQPTINEVIDASGFKHPGIGLTKDILENMRAQVLARKEPWYSYYVAMTQSSYAAKTITISNQSDVDPTKPANVAFNSQGVQSSFIADSLKAYTQALMYYITGDETYRANAMQIIRIWSQMDPAKYAYYTDAHIHSGIPLNRMVTAAEILRYSSSQTEELKWTDKDTADFTNNLITPVIETFQHDNNHFMNQHSYPLMGAMAGYIFTGNRDRYNEAVEWFTVNKTAENQGFNGSIKQLFRLVDTNALTGEKLDQPVVQHVEMGRDQAHGGGDLTNAAIISRMLLAQDTKVDPVDGTVSTKDNAVGPYEFLNDRILAAANYFWKFMLGYDTSWTPVPYVYDENGNVKGIYQKLSDSYRGRMTTANFWDLYYYYTYVKGINVAETAPYYFEAFTKRIPSNFYYQGSFKQNWENVDGGGDFWLYIPKEAESEGAKYLPKEQPSDSLVEIEERYTAFDNNTVIKQEGDASFVEFNATEEGSKIAVLNLSYEDRTKPRLIGLKFRTNGVATLELSKESDSKPFHTLVLPDTKGQWKYVTYDMGISQVSFGQLDKDYSLLYMKVIGDGTTVDVDHFNVKAGEKLTPPLFKGGNAELNIVTFVGAPVTLDFSASDSNPKDVISYESSEMPSGAELNASTGVLKWQPTKAGTNSFIVAASDGTTITTKKVNVVVANDRASAVQAAISQFNPNTLYVTESLNQFKTVYDETMRVIQTASDEAFYQQLLNLKSASESLKLLTPLLQSDGSMDYTNIVTSTFGDAISLLVDNNNNTYPVYTLAPDLYHILDFGVNYKVSASAFSFQSRMNFVDRMAGITVFGSNDMSNWTRLTPGETPFTDDLASLVVNDAYKNEQFRFIKFQMIHPQPDVLHNMIGNMVELGEFRIFGQRHETNNKLESVSISSDKSVNSRIVLGNTVKLTIKAKEALKNVKVKIQGQEALVSTQDNINWTAEAKLDGDVQTGAVKFAIDYQTNDGTNGETAYFTTDNSKLFLVDESDLIDNVTGIANLLDSTTGSGRSAAETLKQVNYLFDNKSSTNSDFRLNGSGSGSYITFDFKEGNQVTLSSVELLARQDQYFGRIKGAVVQGSNDNQTWTTLTKAAAASSDWQILMVSDKVPYRYIRIYNPGAWFGNMAELRLHGVVKSADLTPPVTMDDAPQGWVNKDTTVNFKATDADSSIVATYYTVDGGVQQTGNKVTLATEGTHKLVYWSVDYAGNVEQSHTITVKIDKTAPEVTVTGFENGSLSDAMDVVPVVTIKDSISGVDDSKTQATLDGKAYQLGETIKLYMLPLGKHTFIVNGSDLAGNPTSHTVTFNTAASIEGLKQLVTRFVENKWIDNAGITNSLQKKLEANNLQSFIQEVQAQSGKYVSTEAATYLLRDAHALLN
ncbi:discoidin domain-containing protein [Ectobacillus funiculus]|uniref:OmpL47-type beta-barrel domain-containing protein n=1 Tax=Ectobacillus funiculus TaxID=137993 RepID=UPI00397CF848